MPVKTRGALVGVGLLALFLFEATAAAQTTLLEDGSFQQWATVPGLTGHSVSGAVDSGVGVPAPSYRIEHVHTPGGTFGGSVVSRSTQTSATFDLSTFAAGDRLELTRVIQVRLHHGVRRFQLRGDCIAARRGHQL